MSRVINRVKQPGPAGKKSRKRKMATPPDSGIAMSGSAKKKVSLADVARLSGVSRPVASVALTGNKSNHVRFSEATRQRVLEAARALDYRPNRTAANFRGQRHGSIGVLVHRWGGVRQLLLSRMISAAKRHDLLVVVEQLEGESTPPSLVEEDCVDGLIVFENIDPELLDKLERFPLPLVQINTNRRQGRGCITFDEAGALRLAVEAFARRGRRQVAFVVARPDQPHYSVHERYSALGEACADKGMNPPHRFACATPDEAQVDAIARHLREHPEIDAVVLHLDALAPHLYRAAAQLGKRIPEDLSVIGFNDTAVSAAMIPQMTALSVDHEALADNAVVMLNRLIQGDTAVGNLVAPYELRPRESV
jgi:DNA-binding LacI/PurR family transcriptional regulator